MPEREYARLQAAREAGFLIAGAILLLCAPVFPGLSRLIVLPALLLAPGYALLRLFGQAAGVRSVTVAVPVSIVLVVCASLLLDVSGIRLGTLSLGSVLSAATALFLAGSYARQPADGQAGVPAADMPPRHRRTRPADRELLRHDLTAGESR